MSDFMSEAEEFRQIIEADLINNQTVTEFYREEIDLELKNAYLKILSFYLLSKCPTL